MKKQKKQTKPGTSPPAELRRYTIKQAAELTGISPSSLRRACHIGDLRFMRLTTACNSPILIPGSQLSDWLERCERNQAVLSPAEVRAMRSRTGQEE